MCRSTDMGDPGADPVMGDPGAEPVAMWIKVRMYRPDIQTRYRMVRECVQVHVKFHASQVLDPAKHEPFWIQLSMNPSGSSYDMNPHFVGAQHAGSTLMRTSTGVQWRDSTLIWVPSGATGFIGVQPCMHAGP